MAENELWDLYTADGRKTGQTLQRKDKIPEGFFHLACDILLRHRDGDYLLMQRDAAKTAYPGWWEASVGGAALSGETPEMCIVRECKEETGLSIAEMKRLVLPHPDEDQTLLYTFLGVTDDDKQSVRFQKGETMGYRWLTEEEFLTFAQSEEMIPSQKQRLSKWIEEKLAQRSNKPLL